MGDFARLYSRPAATTLPPTPYGCIQTTLFLVKGRGEEVGPERDVEWEVEQLLASRVHYGKLQYQVRWKGWSADPEWYPAADSPFSSSASYSII